MANAEEWISLREFSRRRAVSLGAVQKAVASGRVTAVKRNPGGSLQGIEYHAATVQWNTNTDVDQAMRAGAPILVSPAPAGDLLAGEPLDLPPAATPPSPKDGDEFGYLQARADRERAQAKRAELDLQERSGELVNARAVRENNFSIYRKLRDSQNAIASRLAPRLAAETDPVRVEHLLNEEIRKSHYELSRALAIDAGGAAGPVTALQ